MSITATWLPDLYGYRLDAAGSTGTVTWYRSAYWPDGRFSNRSIGTGAGIYDLAVPLDGATVTYTAIDGAGVAETTVNPVSTVPVLGLLDRIDVPAAEVVVESFREQTVAGRSVFYDVLDRNEPFVQPMKPIERTGSMTLRVAHTPGPFPNRTLNSLRQMLRTGDRMVLRTTCNERVEDLFFIFTTWREYHFGDNNEHGPDRKVDIDWRAVDPMWGVDVSTTTGRVWATVPQEFGTWADVVTNVASWQDLVDGT